MTESKNFPTPNDVRKKQEAWRERLQTLEDKPLKNNPKLHALKKKVEEETK